MTTWQSAHVPTQRRIGADGWCRLILRAPALAGVVFGGLILLMAVRVIEAPVCGLHRPMSPYITVAVCRAALVILGIRLQREGPTIPDCGTVVSNHASWLDIFALNACRPLYFVSKSEVAGWFGIGWLARATGTVFITRERRHARAHQTLLERRLDVGHQLLIFPEGTSTDGRRVLRFKSSLFEACFSGTPKPRIKVQPVSLIWHAPPGQDCRFYGWWGTMDLAPHLIQVLAHSRRGRVEVVFHDAVSPVQFSSRKELAGWCEETTRRGLQHRLGVDQGDH